MYVEIYIQNLIANTIFAEFLSYITIYEIIYSFCFFQNSKLFSGKYAFILVKILMTAL